MFTLSNENKEKFQHQVNKINNTDETKVRDNINKEINILEEKLAKKPSEKIKTLIDNTKLLYEILSTTEFPISDSSKKWIVFGLGYLVSDVDLIPDIIPLIGYNDDAMIISWVHSMIDDDITRFSYFKKAKDLSTKGKVLKQLVQGQGDKHVILLNGFIEISTTEKEEANWAKLIRSINTNTDTPGISILKWDISYLNEFSKTIPMIDHKLNLKPIYDSEAFGIEWQQLKIDMKNIGKAVYREILNIQEGNPDKEIYIISTDVGSICLISAFAEANHNLASKVFIMGGTTTNDELYNSLTNKVLKSYNFYSDNDHIVRFIYDNYEECKTPIGLGGIQSESAISFFNVDSSKTISRHQDYKFKMADLINKELRRSK